jgi:hypothetical protein
LLMVIGVPFVVGSIVSEGRPLPRPKLIAAGAGRERVADLSASM